MGYFAHGGGSVTLKEGVDKEKLLPILEEKTKNTEIEFDILEGTIAGHPDNYISFWENDDHWHEYDTMEFLNALIPYITAGSAEYSGDEDCNWSYRLVDGKWIEENGTIYYSDEDMVEYLKTKGYKIEKETA